MKRILNNLGGTLNTIETHDQSLKCGEELRKPEL